MAAVARLRSSENLFTAVELCEAESGYNDVSFLARPNQYWLVSERGKTNPCMCVEHTSMGKAKKGGDGGDGGRDGPKHLHGRERESAQQTFLTRCLGNLIKVFSLDEMTRLQQRAPRGEGLTPTPPQLPHPCFQLGLIPRVS